VTWVLVAPRHTLGALRPLVRARERTGEVRVVEPAFGDALAEEVDGAEGLLLVSDRRRSPRTVLPGPFLRGPSGWVAPVGWMPDLGDRLDVVARAAARVELRAGPPGPLAILGPLQRRYLHLADRMEVNVGLPGGPPFPILRWTSDRIVRDDLVRALRLGIGLGIYVGHGRPSGWAAYHGLRGVHLVDVTGEPLGALLSMTCLTANRRRVGLSFSETVVAGGAAAAAVGAVAEVAHVDNMRWMLGLAAALRAGERRLGPALLAAQPNIVGRASPYRIVGDPLAALVGTAEGARRAARVFAPAPDFAT
jgi:hypothetical protein